MATLSSCVEPTVVGSGLYSSAPVLARRVLLVKHDDEWPLPAADAGAGDALPDRDGALMADSMRVASFGKTPRQCPGGAYYPRTATIGKMTGPLADQSQRANHLRDTRWDF
jgi:hypothetical protein